MFRIASRARILILAVFAVSAVILVAQWDRVSELWTPPPPSPGRAQGPPVGDIYPIADNLYVIPGGGANTAVFVTTAGVVLVDPKYSENGEAVLAQVRKVTSNPVTHVINTHCHSDHFGGNSAMPMDAQIVVHDRTARNIARIRRTGDPSSFDGRPVRTFRDRLTLLSGKDRIDLFHFGAAHTDGDTFVVFRDAGVVHAGDVFAGKTSPIVNLAWGGEPREYPATIERAVAGLQNVTRVIPGHAAVVDWQTFVDYGEFTRRLLDHVVAQMKAGHDWNQARKELVVPAKFQEYDLDRLTFTLHDMYKGLTPWWRFW